MYVLDFLKNGEHLYTITSKRGTIVHQQLLEAFEEYNKLLLLQRQRLSFYNPLFVMRVWDLAMSDKFYYADDSFNRAPRGPSRPSDAIVPDRMDVKYLR